MPVTVNSPEYIKYKFKELQYSKALRAMW